VWQNWTLRPKTVEHSTLTLLITLLVDSGISVFSKNHKKCGLTPAFPTDIDIAKSNVVKIAQKPKWKNLLSDLSS
jgi:hypothetical protein